MCSEQDLAADLHSTCGADDSPLALMEFAGEGLISAKSSRDRPAFRLTSPRSDLLCHHAYINLRNLSVILPG